ncbi:MAG: cupin domain-containing protein [Sphingobium sp.]|nr:cupin domain-containing protein [Sphingobium sp.]
MAEPETIVVATADVPMIDFTGGGDFAGQWGRIGPLLGLTDLGCALQLVPPGKKAFPHHVHHCVDELMLILEGSGEYRWGEERFPVKPGDLVGAPKASRAHQLINTGDTDLKYLAFSSNAAADVVEYPDSGKVAYRAGMTGGDRTTGSIRAVGRMTPTDYWDGEVEA